MDDFSFYRRVLFRAPLGECYFSGNLSLTRKFRRLSPRYPSRCSTTIHLYKTTFYLWSHLAAHSCRDIFCPDRQGV